MVWIKILVVAILVTTLLIGALGMKLLLEESKFFTRTSCRLDQRTKANESVCGNCEVKEIINCNEKTDFKK